MVPISVQTLIFAATPAPSVLVLRPEEDAKEGVARIIPIWIGTSEAAALSLALENKRSARPQTHDLFLDALTNLDARVDHMLINEVKGPSYFAKLFLCQAGRQIELDARPSDAVALSLRQGSPMFIDEEALKRGSFPFVFKKQCSQEEEIAQFHSFLSEIAPEDFKI